MNYESVRVFSAVAGSLILASAYLVAVLLTFRRRARSAQERTALVIFDDEDKPIVKENASGRE